MPDAFLPIFQVYIYLTCVSEHLLSLMTELTELECYLITLPRIWAKLQRGLTSYGK